MKNVIQEIIKWSADLLYWEKAALDKVLSRKSLEDKDYEELLQYLLEDAGLSKSNGDRKVLDFQQDTALDLDECKPILLKEISTLTNINALVTGQRLTFSPQLTAIFGRNGSGKSGYARVLGCAGFTRGDKTVLPDVSRPVAGSTSMSAKITLEENCQPKVITYQVGQACSELASFYVFDSTSVQVHMKGKNTFSFAPAGLSILTELANVTDEVRKRLSARITEKEQPSDFIKYFAGASDITALVETLSPDTDLERLTSLSGLFAEEEKHIHELNITIGKIGLEKVQEEIQKREGELDSLQRLSAWLRKADDLLGDLAIATLDRQFHSYQDLSQKARQLSMDHFKQARFSQVGTELWDQLIRVARQLAEAESRENPYPKIGDPCLLCQQPLSEDAQRLILDLWAYLAGDIKKDMEIVSANLQATHVELEDFLRFFLHVDLAPGIDLLRSKVPDLADKLQQSVEAYRLRGGQVTKSLTEKQTSKIVIPLREDHREDLRMYIQQFEEEIDLSKKEDLEKKRQGLEDERRRLEHRKRLKELLPDIKDYVEGRVWAREAAKIMGSTHHITAKYNQIFNELVKKRYLSIFEQTLTDLGRPIKVMISTSGSKGKTQKQVVLKVHDTAKSLADPDKVLSEGEKRAVALADFLTEVALDTTSNGIILDDPVTSLDLEWRRTIAQILTREAGKRQVIVFTHDMPFLYLLLNHADALELDKQVHWIKRGDDDDRPGYVWLNNCPALEREYRKPTLAEDCYVRARNESQPQYQERILKEGFGSLRTTYEAFIVFEMLNGAVQRFEERISFGSLESIAWDQGIVNDVVRACERLSRYIEGHLHSDAMGSLTELTHELLRDEINQFYAIRKRLKDLKNN